MAQHIVTCRLCGLKFDTNQMIEGEEWIKPSNLRYYHTKCYNEWINHDNVTNPETSEAFWYEAVITFLYVDLKMSVDFAKLDNQWKSFQKKNMTAKGIYFALRYFYQIKHGDMKKADGGIGIVTYIYSESSQYWSNQENKKEGTLAAIVEELKKRDKREVVEVFRVRGASKKKSKWSLDNISQEGE